jgi:Transposase domain (DUF772)
MALGRARVQQGFQDPRDILGDRLREGSLYRLLADHGQAMFPDGYFADLYSGSVQGQPTIPARVVATVMVLQAFEGLSDREACDRLEADLRWQAAESVDAGEPGVPPDGAGRDAQQAAGLGPAAAAVRRTPRSSRARPAR